jgi:hypothetical protein
MLCRLYDVLFFRWGRFAWSQKGKVCRMFGVTRDRWAATTRLVGGGKGMAGLAGLYGSAVLGVRAPAALCFRRQLARAHIFHDRWTASQELVDGIQITRCLALSGRQHEWKETLDRIHGSQRFGVDLDEVRDALVPMLAPRQRHVKGTASVGIG